MEPWPFTPCEWNAVQDAALPVINAGLAEDRVLRASRLVGLLGVLADLRVRHGEHPALLETEADFIDGDVERVRLYRRAVELATAHGLQTVSIRLSLARVLLNLGQSAEAAAELAACEGELPNGDDWDQVEWAELVAEASG